MTEGHLTSGSTYVERMLPERRLFVNTTLDVVSRLCSMYVNLANMNSWPTGCQDQNGLYMYANIMGNMFHEYLFRGAPINVHDRHSCNAAGQLGSVHQ